ncbi:hypothetical protein F5051DRAFT_108194 [Lentinula edodes]|nr:hypothetical protein F5051DRAFT_108194 [Lentinula edodes]
MLNWTPTKKLSEVHLFLESCVGRRKISLLPYNSSSPVISPPSRWDAGVCHADLRLQSLGALFITIWSFIGHYIPKEVRHGTSRKCDVRGVDGPEFDFFSCCTCLGRLDSGIEPNDNDTQIIISRILNAAAMTTVSVWIQTRRNYASCII